MAPPSNTSASKQRSDREYDRPRRDGRLRDVILLHPTDTVCVAARELSSGTSLDFPDRRLQLLDNITQGHKIAWTTIQPGEAILKWGQTIGYATSRIEAGEWVHTQNMTAGALRQNYEKSTAIPADPAPLTDYTFQGYRRADGKAGTRNYIAVISSVNCSAAVARRAAAKFTAERLRDYPNVDGVLAFSHGTGCAMQFGGEHHRMLNRVMGGMARHPNIGAYILVGLGCEVGSIGHLIQDQGLVQIGGLDSVDAQSASRPIVLSMQDLGGTQKTLDAAEKLVESLLPKVNAARRVTIPASEIVLGLNCGGSDGNSGITANAALGVASDLMVACGGTTILGETTEMYGAEQLLTRRARTPAVADKLIERIRWWEWYTGVFGCTPDNNPSPGNKVGGLTTIYEKSLGAIAKAGTTALNDVVQYAEPVRSRGFVVMDTPGMDSVSVTGIVAGGANVMMFTTGRGSCLGFKPTPVIKIASNTPMYDRMSDDMDVNAGTILSEGRSVEDVGEEIFKQILSVASGEKTKSEQMGLGEEEFQPWILGPVL
jgi:altronate hydrolase